MTRILFALLLASHGLALAQTKSSAAEPVTKTSNDSAHRRKVFVVAKPKAILPAQKDLVSTAQSGASRAAKTPAILPNLSPPESTVKTTQVGGTQKGHWVLFYRTTVCIPCDRLMNALSANETSGAPAAERLTILVADSHRHATTARQNATNSKPARNTGAAPASTASSTVSAAQQGELNALRTRYPALNNATWTFDTANIVDSLKPSGAPMMYGMDGSHVIWRAAGMPGGTALTQQRVASWLSSQSSAEIIAATVASAIGTRP